MGESNSTSPSTSSVVAVLGGDTTGGARAAGLATGGSATGDSSGGAVSAGGFVGGDFVKNDMMLRCVIGDEPLLRAGPGAMPAPAGLDFRAKFD